MLVDISSNPLRSPKVLLLATAEATKYAAQQEVAEAMLGLSSTFVSGLATAQLTRVSHAVVLQLNMQVEQGLDPFIVQSESAAAQDESVTYRDVAIHPQAAAILSAVQVEAGKDSNMVEAFGNIAAVRSVRTAGGGGSPTKAYWPKGRL